MVFRLFKLRPTAIRIAVVVSIGALAIGGIYTIWSFSAPLSDRVMVVRFVIPIVPQVNGPVTKIHAQPNTPLRGGKDLLLETQPDIFKNNVDQLTAALAAATRNIDQLQAAAIAAEAALRRADALKGAADAEFQVASNAAQVGSRGMLAVKFDLEGEELAGQLKMGTAGVATIYTERGKPIHFISKVVIRVKALQYYLLPF